jgi:hypothetical protein
MLLLRSCIHLREIQYLQEDSMLTLKVQGVLAIAFLAIGLLFPVCASASGYTGCNIVISVDYFYAGGVIDPGNQAACCACGNCRTSTVYKCGTWQDVEICFADTSWSCQTATAVPTTDPNPELMCGQHKYVPVNCESTGGASANWCVCVSCVRELPGFVV